MKQRLLMSIGCILLVWSSGLPIMMSSEPVHPKDTSVDAEETAYWAVIVSTNVSNMTFVYNTLLATKNWDASHMLLLEKQAATRANILDALDWLAEQSSSEDMVLFSHNGHGSHVDNRYGIVPWDDHQVIFTDELDEKFDRIACKQLCLIFDCCFSGSFIDGRPSTLSHLGGRKFQTMMAAGLDEPGRFIMMSTMKRGTGIYTEVQIDNQSLVIDFIRFFTQGINEGNDPNGDGWISAEESYKYGRKKYLPYAMLLFFSPLVQLTSLLISGTIAMPFPTCFDGVEGELLLVQL